MLLYNSHSFAHLIFGTDVIIIQYLWNRYHYPERTDEETVAQRFGDLLRVTQLVESRARYKSRSQHDASCGVERLKSWTLDKWEDTANIRLNQEMFR